MKKANRKQFAKKRVTPKKKLANKKAAPKNAQMATRAGSKKTTRRETASSLKKQVRVKSRSLDTVEFAPEEVRSDWRPGELSGLSRVEDADSESVAELLEEGNTFEADAVKGVEDAPNADEGPVRTHEVPEDDVPDEVIPDEYKHKE
jgi:hypothetical protein